MSFTIGILTWILKAKWVYSLPILMFGIYQAYIHVPTSHNENIK